MRKLISWWCEPCKRELTLKPNKPARDFLKAGNRVVMDCECGTRYVISKKHVRTMQQVLEKLERKQKQRNCILYFREILRTHDPIDEVEWENKWRQWLKDKQNDA